MLDATADSTLSTRGWLPPAVLRPLRFFGDSTTFGRVVAIRPVGDYLIVADALSDPHVAVFDLRSGKLLYRIGRNGAGPAEFRAPHWIVSQSESPPVALVYDFQNRRATRLRLDRGVDGAIVDEIALDFGASLLEPFPLPSGQVVSNGLFPDHTLVMIDAEKGVVRRIEGNPAFTADDITAPHALRLLNRNFLAVSPSGRRMAVVYQFKPQIDFYDSTGNHLRTIRGPRDTKASFRLEGNRFFWNEDNQTAYWTASASDNAVFAVFCGCVSIVDEGTTHRLHAFSWDGTVIGESSFPGTVSSITVTPDGKLLFAGVEDPYPRVAQFRLVDSNRNGGAR